MDIKEVLKKKTRVKFYVPLGMSYDESHKYSIELMDMVSAFVDPIGDGVNKGDILEFLTNNLYAEMDLFTFLRHKRIIALVKDFETLFLKYSRSVTTGDTRFIDGYEVSLSDLTDVAPEVIDSQIMQILSGLKEATTEKRREPGQKTTPIYYNIKACKFSYFKSV